MGRTPKPCGCPKVTQVTFSSQAFENRIHSRQRLASASSVCELSAYNQGVEQSEIPEATVDACMAKRKQNTKSITSVNPVDLIPLTSLKGKLM